MPNKLIAFIPVIHKGYLDLLKKDFDEVWILGKEIIDSRNSLLRDVRTIVPEELKKILESSGICRKVLVASFADLEKMAKEGGEIVMIDDDISRDIANKYFPKKPVTFEKVFLRWDKLMTEKENVVPEGRKISEKAADKKFIKMAEGEAAESADWWRQIGAVAVKGGKVLFKSHNRHLPTDFHLSYYGDPRVNFDKGERLDVYTSIHGEADIVAQAAKTGKSLKGTYIYVTTFPCPNCARLLGEAGVKKVLYSRGYSRRDAEGVLNAYGVEIILLESSVTRKSRAK